MSANILYLIALFCVLEAKKAPIIGILSQETYSVDHLFPNENYRSYIAASYVKFVESAGAMVVPVWIGREKDYYKEIIRNTNGILLPGGGTWFNESGGYADAGQMLYDIAVDINEKGDYFPIFGICLGMELLAQVPLNGTEIRAHCDSKKTALPLKFKEGISGSKLFSSASKEIISILSTEAVTYNSHELCVTEKNFTRFGLSSDWRVLSINWDVNGLKFISSFESKKHPFYGVQFHPEKNLFEFKAALRIPNSLQASQASQYFANFFVEEARKNSHSFPNWAAETQALIYNYPVTYTGSRNSSFEQAYMFSIEVNNQRTETKFTKDAFEI